MSAEIAAVEPIGLESPIEQPFGYAQSWVDTRSALLVKIETIDGEVGWGECWGPIAGTRETIEAFFSPLLVGEDPTRIERLHEMMHQRARAAYQSVVPFPALSGIDIALWDLTGKLRDQPVSALLGGRHRDAVRAYATGHYFKHGHSLEEQYELIAEESRGNAERFGAVKAKIGLQLMGYGPDEDLTLIRHIREAIGPETTLMVDANYAYDIGTARSVASELEDLDVYWFEEPIPPKQLEGYARLAQESDLRIAGGECLVPYEFERFLVRGALDIAQPDLANVGGITAARKIDIMSRQHNVQVVPHVWGTPLAIAASLQYIATLPGDPWLEFDNSSNPLREELSDESFAVDAGQVTVPDGPGLGIELDPDVIAEYRVRDSQ